MLNGGKTEFLQAGGTDILDKQYGAFKAALNKELMAEFSCASYVTLIDTQWGRNDYLWQFVDSLQAARPPTGPTPFGQRRRIFQKVKM